MAVFGCKYCELSFSTIQKIESHFIQSHPEISSKEKLKELKTLERESKVKSTKKSSSSDKRQVSNAKKYNPTANNNNNTKKIILLSKKCA